MYDGKVSCGGNDSIIIIMTGTTSGTTASTVTIQTPTTTGKFCLWWTVETC